MRFLGDLVGDVEFGDPFFLRNLIVYPLKVSELFDETKIPCSLEEGNFSLRELDPPQIDAVSFENLSERPILILDGEELLGARQDRISNTSVWLDAGRSYRLPVSCVEERRWEGESTFIPGKAILNPSLRTVLCRGVSKSLSQNRGYKSDQRSLWESIRRTLSTLRVSSRTFSIHDAYETLKSEIERYASEAEGLNEGFSGFIIETPSLIAIDVFGSKRILFKFLKKLIKSYLIEGFLSKRSSSISIRRMKRMLTCLEVSFVKRYPAVGCGVELRFGDDSKLLGKALMVDGKLVHFSLFKVR